MGGLGSPLGRPGSGPGLFSRHGAAALKAAARGGGSGFPDDASTGTRESAYDDKHQGSTGANTRGKAQEENPSPAPPLPRFAQSTAASSSRHHANGTRNTSTPSKRTSSRAKSTSRTVGGRSGSPALARRQGGRAAASAHTTAGDHDSDREDVASPSAREQVPTPSLTEPPSSTPGGGAGAHKPTSRAFFSNPRAHTPGLARSRNIESGTHGGVRADSRSRVATGRVTSSRSRSRPASRGLGGSRGVSAGRSRTPQTDGNSRPASRAGSSSRRVPVSTPQSGRPSSNGRRPARSGSRPQSSLRREGPKGVEGGSTSPSQADVSRVTPPKQPQESTQLQLSPSGLDASRSRGFDGGSPHGEAWEGVHHELTLHEGGPQEESGGDADAVAELLAGLHSMNEGLMDLARGGSSTLTRGGWTVVRGGCLKVIPKTLSCKR